MVNMFTSSAVDSEFKSWLGQTKDYKIGSCCFSAIHAVFRGKSKDWLAVNQNKDWLAVNQNKDWLAVNQNKDWLVVNQNNVSEWQGCCFSELAL